MPFWLAHFVDATSFNLKGIFKTEDSVVTSIISKDEFYSLQSERFIDEAFSGSLPAFLTAFTSRKKLTEKEVERLQQLIDEYKG